MGWENFLRPGEDPSDDFTQHRAQMRHYDDYMGRVESAGITGSFSTGFSYSSDNGGSSSDGPSAVSVAGPNSGVRVASKPSSDDSGDSSLFVELDPVMEPENTEVNFGIRLMPHPNFSDLETGAEQRYGDIVAIPFGIGNIIADIAYNLDRFDKWNQERRRTQGPRVDEYIRHGRQEALESGVYDPFEPITFGTGGYVTGGGF